jgi:predicted transcriptional regulator
MPRSRLEKYLSILEALVPKPLKIEKISYKTNIECSVLKQNLDFLTLYKLIEERSLGKERVIYAITERGLAVFKTLQAQKYFQKIKKILPVVEEAGEVEPLLSRQPSQFEEEN